MVQLPGDPASESTQRSSASRWAENGSGAVGPAGGLPGSGRPNAQSRQGRNEERSDEPGIAAVVAELRAEIARVAREVGVLGRLRIERAKLASKEAAHSVLLGSWAAVVGVAFTVTTSVLFVLGLSGAISDLAGDRLWAGPLVIGSVGLFGAWFALSWVRRQIDAKAVVSIRRRFGTPATASGSTSRAETGSQNGGS